MSEQAVDSGKKCEMKETLEGINDKLSILLSKNPDHEIINELMHQLQLQKEKFDKVNHNYCKNINKLNKELDAERKAKESGAQDLAQAMMLIGKQELELAKLREVVATRSSQKSAEASHNENLIAGNVKLVAENHTLREENKRMMVQLENYKMALGIIQEVEHTKEMEETKKEMEKLSTSGNFQDPSEVNAAINAITNHVSYWVTEDGIELSEPRLSATGMPSRPVMVQDWLSDNYIVEFPPKKTMTKTTTYETPTYEMTTYEADSDDSW